MSWPLVKLGDVSERIDYGLTASAVDKKDGPRFLRITDMQDDAVDWKTVPSCECSDREYEENKLSIGDIVFARTGATTGKSYLVRELKESAVFASYLIRVRPSEKVDPIYLSYFFKSPMYWHQISAMANGAAQPGVNSSKLKELEIPLPPLPEQKRIAAILDKADAIRRKRQQAIQLADDFLRAVFLDMFGDPVTNPKGWPKKTLKLLGKSTTGRTPPSEKAGMWGEGLPFVTPGDLSGRVDTSAREVTQEGAEHSKVCRTGSLLVCCIGATIGKAGIAGRPVAFNQQINAQEWGAEISDVYGFFIFKLFPEVVTQRAIQTTLPILKKSLFDEIEIPVPAKDIQERFSTLAQKVSSFSARHESGVEMPIFESLSQLAFSGKL